MKSTNCRTSLRVSKRNVYSLIKKLIAELSKTELIELMGEIASKLSNSINKDSSCALVSKNSTVNEESLLINFNESEEYLMSQKSSKTTNNSRKKSKVNSKDEKSFNSIKYRKTANKIIARQCGVKDCPRGEDADDSQKSVEDFTSYSMSINDASWRMENNGMVSGDPGTRQNSLSHCVNHNNMTTNKADRPRSRQTSKHEGDVVNSRVWSSKEAKLSLPAPHDLSSRCSPLCVVSLRAPEMIEMPPPPQIDPADILAHNLEMATMLSAFMVPASLSCVHEVSIDSSSSSDSTCSTCSTCSNTHDSENFRNLSDDKVSSCRTIVGTNHRRSERQSEGCGDYSSNKASLVELLPIIHASFPVRLNKISNTIKPNIHFTESKRLQPVSIKRWDEQSSDSSISISPTKSLQGHSHPHTVEYCKPKRPSESTNSTLSTALASLHHYYRNNATVTKSFSKSASTSSVLLSDSHRTTRFRNSSSSDKRIQRTPSFNLLHQHFNSTLSQSRLPQTLRRQSHHRQPSQPCISTSALLNSRLGQSWRCSYKRCQVINLSRFASCVGCNNQRWHVHGRFVRDTLCPRCGFINYKTRVNCKKCSLDFTSAGSTGAGSNSGLAVSLGGLGSSHQIIPTRPSLARSSTNPLHITSFIR